MNNKGFTLVELLAVILILIGIAAVSVFNVSSALFNNEEQQCEKQGELVKNAAKIYFSLNDGDTEVTVGKLIDEGYFKKTDVSLYSRDKVIYNNNSIQVSDCSQ